MLNIKKKMSSFSSGGPCMKRITDFRRLRLHLVSHVNNDMKTMGQISKFSKFKIFRKWATCSVHVSNLLFSRWLEEITSTRKWSNTENNKVSRLLVCRNYFGFCEHIAVLEFETGFNLKGWTRRMLVYPGFWGGWELCILFESYKHVHKFGKIAMENQVRYASHSCKLAGLNVKF